MDSINHKSLKRIPTMYRGEPSVNEKLIKYFGIKDIEKNWQTLIELLGADNYSDGETLGGFTTYFPKYRGPDFETVFEINRFNIWGIKPVEIDSGSEINIVFSKKPPLYDKDDIKDINKYNFPKLEWFDFNIYKNNSEQVIYKSEDEQQEIKLKDFKKSEEYFLCASCMNSLFMVTIYLRGMDKLFMDLSLNEKYAETLISKIGEFMLEFNIRNLKSIGNYIDMYGIWDDFADQDNLMISPEMWRKYYKPWDKRLIEEAKKYNILVCFHVCGNCSEIIPDLIEMGVDILDPVQVSAKNMELENLKKRFGKDLCFHGGLDSQKFLKQSDPNKIRKKVREINNLFASDGGIILGPSHYLTPDVPIDNILAIYKAPK